MPTAQPQETDLIRYLVRKQHENLWTDEQLADDFLKVKRSTWAMARNRYTRLGPKVLGRIASQDPGSHPAIIQYVIEADTLADERKSKKASAEVAAAAAA